MNTKRYKNAKWLDFEEIDNMESKLFSYLMKENQKRSGRFEKYVHDKIMNMNPVDVEFFKEILLKKLFNLKTKYLKTYHDISRSDREQKASYYRNLIDKHTDKMNKFFQDKLGKPHFYLTDYYIFNGDSKESGPQGLRQAIGLEDFFEKI